MVNAGGSLTSASDLDHNIAVGVAETESWRSRAHVHGWAQRSPAFKLPGSEQRVTGFIGDSPIRGWQALSSGWFALRVFMRRVGTVQDWEGDVNLQDIKQLWGGCDYKEQTG